VGSRDDSTKRDDNVTESVLADPKHGPLPGLLLLMTAATGVVDAVSILSRGRVVVANMTGNIVFIGFAVVGAKGFALAASLLALAGFLAGASAGGSALARLGGDRATALRNVVAAELALLLVALLLAAVGGQPITGATADAMATVMAVALGAQNSVVRRLAIPDLTTTVLTMTLTGIAADFRAQQPTVVLRRLLAVATMLAGAVIGALLDLHVNPAVAVGAAMALLGAVLICTLRISPTACWRGWPG
jgi:uncharacterized membrane protein YoaK (UPF0700 family)